MLSALLAFVGALVYGSADFLGGLAAKRLRSIVVTGAAAASGELVLLVPALLASPSWRAEDAAWGALAGVFGVVSVVLLYACLAIGPMSILSPLTAVVSAIAPMLWGLLLGGESLSEAGYVGLGIAVVAVVLVGFIPGEKVVRPTARGLLMAVGAGAAIGGFLIVLDQTGPDSGVMPLLVSRTTTALLTCVAIAVLVVAAVRRGRTAASAFSVADPALSTSRAWVLAAACGVVDAGANVLLLLALRAGDLSVVSALTALYPAGTILLAAVVLRERVAPVQWIGLALAVLAGGLLALA